MGNGMEICALCGLPIYKIPHIICATCHEAICIDCYNALADKKKCPICARKKAKVRISLKADLLVKVATTVHGKSLEDKLNRCIEIGYEKLVKP